MEPATITAIANDVGNDVVFLRQLIAHAQPDDVAVAISTSGGSRNVIAALEEARKRGLLTVALLGYDGGEIGRRGLADRSHRRALRLHPAHPGGAGLGLPRHPRAAGGAGAMPDLELFGTATCPFTRDMREWLEWKRRTFVEYDVEADAEALARLRALAGAARRAGPGRGRPGRAGRLAGPRLHPGSAVSRRRR